MERELLLLGLLRGQEMHGYQLYDFIDGHLGTGVHLKKATAYRLLNRMAEEEWVSFREEQEGNRPARRVYAITPRGEAAFQRLLRESLSDYTPLDFLGHIALLFLDDLPAAEAARLLRQRRAAVEKLLQATRTHDAAHGSSGLLLQHQARHLAADLRWLDEVIAGLEPSSAARAAAERFPEQGRRAPAPPTPAVHRSMERQKRAKVEPPPAVDSRPQPARRRPKPTWRPEID